MINRIKKIILRIKEKGIKHVIVHGLKYVKIISKMKMDKYIKNTMCLLTKNIPLKNYIIIESHNDFDCNGGAFYDYLINHNYNKNYKIVWLIKHKLTKQLPSNVKAFNIYKPSFKKNYYICLASYLMCDDIITEKVRDDQISLYLTHGAISFKNIKGLINLPESIDYVASASENHDPYNCNNLSLPYPNNKMIYLGYPSHDILFSDKVAELYKLTKNTYNKVFLWMPTFRKSGGNVASRNDSDADYPYGVPLIQDESQFQILNTLLINNNSLLIIKIHPMQDPETLKNLKNYNNIIVLDAMKTKELDINVYGLMRDADALISDYSSSAYSYLLLNRPIAFALSDLKEYKLSFDFEKTKQFLVGDIVFEFEEFIQFFENVVTDIDSHKEERTNLLNWIYKYKDGFACKRLAEFLKLKK